MSHFLWINIFFFSLKAFLMRTTLSVDISPTPILTLQYRRNAKDNHDFDVDVDVDIRFDKRARFFFFFFNINVNVTYFHAWQQMITILVLMKRHCYVEFLKLCGSKGWSQFEIKNTKQISKQATVIKKNKFMQLFLCFFLKVF